MDVGWQALIAGLLAGLVGLVELITRYRSNPRFALLQFAAGLYVGLNAVAGVVALLLVRAFGWNFGQTKNIDLWRILVAGFGAVALFRSSLFVTKIGGSDVNVGPSLVLGGLLDACDREVDRKSAEDMSSVINASELKGLNPLSVMTALPVLCLALMQNFAASDQALLGSELSKIRGDTSLTDDVKMRAVIVQLAKYLGHDVVTRVLTSAPDVFLLPPPPATEPPAAAKAAVLEQAKKLT